MVGTALVACHFSVYRSLRMLRPEEVSLWNQGQWLVFGLAAGLALGGPLLFVARRSRGMCFPMHPGETLWILQGIACLCAIAVQMTIGVFILLEGSDGFFDPGDYLLRWGLHFARCVLVATIYLVAARRTRIGRWRVFFYAHTAHYAAYLVFTCAGFTLARYWTFLFPGGVLAAVVLTDVLRRGRYPWSHWSGVAIYFWFCGGSICSMVYYTFFLPSNL